MSLRQRHKPAAGTHTRVKTTYEMRGLHIKNFVEPVVCVQNSSMTHTEILESARMLRPVERLHLIDALLESLDEPDPRIASAWQVEAQDRLAAFDHGELRAGPIEELFAKVRAL